MNPERGSRTPESRIEHAYTEFCDAWLDGKKPDIDAFCRKHSSCRSELRTRLESFIDMYHCFQECRRESGDKVVEPAAEARDVNGRILGDFRLVREIGRGGMGVVYEARQISLDRTVALKVLPAHLTLRKETVARFRREASTAAKLKHPEIVEIYTIGEAEGNEFFAMELVEGTPLDEVIDQITFSSDSPPTGQHIARAVQKTRHRWEGSSSSGDPGGEERGRLSRFWDRTYIEVVCRIVAEVAGALHYAHRAGVIHRDVKPSNILVRENGSVVLTDFGLAREEGLPSLTVTGELAGTPHYIAPEQASPRRGRLDHRVDIYSLGVTLYELITLMRPFDGRTSQEVLGKIISREPRAPRTQNALIPKDIETICLTAMDKDPSRRYQSAMEFREDLLSFLEYRPIKARPVGLATRTYRLVRRHPGYSILSAVLLLLLLGGPLVYGIQHKRANVRIKAALDAKNAALLRAENEAFTARQVSSYLEDIFADFYDCHARGEEVTAYDLLQRNVETMESRLVDQPRLLAELLRSVALVQGILGHTAEAENLLEKSLDTFLRVKGEDEPETLHCMLHIAEMQLRGYRLGEAQPLLEECIDKCREILGDDHPDTLRAMHLLGNLHFSESRFDEAESFYSDLLDHFVALGDDHPETLHYMMHIGEVYERQNRAGEAEFVLTECLKRCRGALGSEHPFSMRTMHSLGILFESKGRFRDAESCYEELWNHYRKLGDEHPEAIHYEMHVGILYSSQERYKEAEPVLTGCLEKCRRVLGNDHPVTTRVLNSLGYLYAQTGRINKADPYFLELFDRREQLLVSARDTHGDDHLMTHFQKINLATLLRQLGRLDEAEDILVDILLRLEPENAVRLGVVSLLALIMRDKGRHEEAEPFLLEALEWQKRVSAGSPLGLHDIQFQVAEFYRGMDRSDEAEPLYLESLTGFRRFADDDHPGLLRIITSLATLYRSEGRIDEARPLAREALEKTRPGTPSYWYRKTLVEQCR